MDIRSLRMAYFVKLGYDLFDRFGRMQFSAEGCVAIKLNNQ